METINQIIQQVINSFDFTYCIVVNVLTYLLVTVLIYICRVDIKLIVNSSILAPVSWTWIIKPILAKFGYDYKNIDNKIN